MRDVLFCIDTRWFWILNFVWVALKIQLLEICKNSLYGFVYSRSFSLLLVYQNSLGYNFQNKCIYSFNFEISLCNCNCNWLTIFSSLYLQLLSFLGKFSHCFLKSTLMFKKHFWMSEKNILMLSKWTTKFGLFWTTWISVLFLLITECKLWISWPLFGMVI